MNSDKPTSLDQLLQHVSFLLAKQSEQVLQEQLGIGLSQLRILRALQNNPRMKQRQIANELGQTEASISRQVKLMIEQNLLHVIVNPLSRREHLTQVTSKGAKLTDAALQSLAKYHAPMFEGLSEKQQQLMEILSTLKINLESNIA
jgi:DNA-binding MarR family transcriptional regulator